MREIDGSLKILHIVLSIGETSAAYNEHCLPWADERDISICTFFRSAVSPPRTITVFEGDGSLGGFFRALSTALDNKAYDVIHAHSPHVGLLSLVATLGGRQNFRPSAVVTVHDSYPNYKPRNRFMFMPVFAAYRRVICCSRASLESFPALYHKLAGDRLGFVQNGLDIERVDGIATSIQRKNHRNGAFTIAAVGRLVDIKNPATVVDAFQLSRDDNSRLVYVGDGPLRPSLTARSREKGTADQIEFTGLIPREQVFENLLGADLFVSASRGEGLPIAVLEAMACCCPVLLSDIPPHREIAEGVDFIPLIDPDDVAGFSREIKKFREMPVAERMTLGESCRKLVETRFGLDAMHAGYAEVYAEITGYEPASLMGAVSSAPVN